VRIEDDQGARFVHTSFSPSGSGAHSMEPFSGQAVLNRREKRRWVGLMTIRFASGKTRATPWGRLREAVLIERAQQLGNGQRSKVILHPPDPVPVPTGVGRETGKVHPVTDDQPDKQHDGKRTGQDHSGNFP
jgi:hypothetical protein